MIRAQSSKENNVYLTLILLLGTVLRLWKLGSQSFWWDEVYSATLSAKGLETVIPRFGQTPTLYHILLHFWLYLGNSDTIIRLLSVLFGVIALWVVYLLGKNLLDARHGLVCAFILAISPFHIWYSQEARMYSLLILLATASMLFFMKFLKENRRWTVLCWVVSSGLAIYTHYYAAFVLVSQILFFLLFWRQYRSHRPRFIWAVVAQGIIILPIVFLFFFGERYAAICSEGAGGNPLRLLSFPYTFFAFSLGFSFGPSVAELHWDATLSTARPYMAQILLALGLFSTIFMIGLRSLRRERERLSLILLYLLVPIVGAGLFSLIRPQFSYNVRYVSTALPAYGLVLARGLLALRRKSIRWVLLILLIAVTAVSIHNYYYLDKYAKEDYRSAAELIEDRAQEGDIVLVTHPTPFQYYYRGHLPARSLFWSPTFYRKIISIRLQGYHRAWFVLSRQWRRDPQGKMSAFFSDTFPAVEETTFANLYLGLYDLTESRTNMRIGPPKKRER